MEQLQTEHGPVTAITAHELTVLKETHPDLFLLDVRSPEEHEEGHIEKDILVPVETVAEKMKDFPKDRKIITYCRRGPRSMQAALTLQALGFTDVAFLKGGFEGWQQR